MIVEAIKHFHIHPHNNYVYCLSEGPLAWKNLVKEDRKGAASIFAVKCHFCGSLNFASTSMQHRTGKRGPMAHDVNTRLALGALNAGMGHTHVNSLLSCLDIPRPGRERLEKQ